MSDDIIYTINFGTNDEAIYNKYNAADYFFGPEEDIIENHDFQGFADQIIAVAMGWA